MPVTPHHSLRSRRGPRKQKIRPSESLRPKTAKFRADFDAEDAALRPSGKDDKLKAAEKSLRFSGFRQVRIISLALSTLTNE